MLSVSQARSNPCKSAHDPVIKGSVAPCTGVLIPSTAAINCVLLKAKSVKWDSLYKKQREFCDAQKVGLVRQIGIEKMRTSAEKARGDKLDKALIELSSRPKPDEPIWKKSEFWGTVMFVLGVAATVAVYELAKGMK